MAITGLHPILYVDDQYAERDFYQLFGFETVYEGSEFPGFLAVARGPVNFGLSTRPGLRNDGIADLRWQLMVDDIDEILIVCETAHLPHETEVEVGGTTHRTRIVKVRSPNGVQVWFEGPNEIEQSRSQAPRTLRAPGVQGRTVDVLPFQLEPSPPEAWRTYDGVVTATAAARTDFYLNPGGADSADAESMMNAATLLGLPEAGDFQLSARVTVDFQAQYDAGVLLLWSDEKHWAKFCFEFSPDAEPMVVSVVTREVSDDANAFTVAERSVWLRISRIDRVYAFHASTDGSIWRLIRVFTLGDEVSGHRIGFEAQSPTGDGCTVTFTGIRFSADRLAELRDGS